VCELSFNGLRVSFIVEVSTARAGQVVILVNFPSLPLCVTASVLKADPMLSPVADLADVYVIKGGHICFGLEAKIVKADFTACTLNGRAGYRANFLRCEASLFKDEIIQVNSASILSQIVLLKNLRTYLVTFLLKTMYKLSV